MRVPVAEIKVLPSGFEVVSRHLLFMKFCVRLEGGDLMDGMRTRTHYARHNCYRVISPVPNKDSASLERRFRRRLFEHLRNIRFAQPERSTLPQRGQSG